MSFGNQAKQKRRSRPSTGIVYFSHSLARFEAMSAALSIIVVETDRTRAQLIVDSLRDAGDFDIFIISEVTGLARQIQARNPDVVLIDIENPSRDTMEELALASGPLDRPVAMFVDRSDVGLSSAAIEAGVSAYIVDGLQSQCVKPIMDAAIAGFGCSSACAQSWRKPKRRSRNARLLSAPRAC